MSALSDFCKELHLNEDFLLKFNEIELTDFAHIAQQKEDWKVLEIISSRVLELDPNNEECLFLKGQAIYNQDKYSDESVACYDKVISIGGKRLKMALWGKSVVYTMQSKFQDALKYCNQALDIEFDEDDIFLLDLKMDILFFLSQEIADLGNYQDALEYCNQALDISDNPDITEFKCTILFHLCHNLTNSGNYQDALKFYDELLKICPLDNADDTWYNKGICQYHLDQLDSALECFNYAIELNDNHIKSWRGKVNVFRKLGKHDESIKCYEHLLAVNSEDAVTWYDKGDSHSMLGQISDAIFCYEKALEIKPDYVQAWHNKGVAHQQRNEMQKAMECYDNALKIEPKFVLSLLNKGALHYSLGQDEEGNVCFSNAKNFEK